MKQPDEKKAPGTRWVFQSNHESATHLSGRTCTVTDEDPNHPWHYIVRDESGTWLAMDCELTEVAS